METMTINKYVERMGGTTFSDETFDLMETGKHIDYLFTQEGGIPKACNFMLVGDPGIGKTTISLDILSDLKMNGYKVLYVSAEMNDIDMKPYNDRYPKFKNIPTFYTGKYIDSNIKEILSDVLDEGYDVVLIDSFIELQDDIRNNGISKNEAEKILVSLLKKHNNGSNKLNKKTTFIAIQQVTKGGIFVGSNKLKHDFSGSLIIRREKETKKTYMFFDKNRRGPNYVNLYFELGQHGDVEYDMTTFELQLNEKQKILVKK